MTREHLYLARLSYLTVFAQIFIHNLMFMKNVFKSKTIWFNGLTIILAVATFYGFTPNAELAEMTTALLVAISPVINLGLRFVTKEAITIK